MKFGLPLQNRLYLFGMSKTAKCHVDIIPEMSPAIASDVDTIAHFKLPIIFQFIS